MADLAAPFIYYLRYIFNITGPPMSYYGSASMDSEDMRSVTYEGAQVWRTPLRSAADYHIFKKLVDNQDVDVWRADRARVDYLVDRQDQRKVLRILQGQKLRPFVLIGDVQKVIDANNVQPTLWSGTFLRTGHRLDFDSYPTIEVIEEYYQYLRNNFDSHVKIETIGRSWEYRPIRMITVSNGQPTNKRMLILGGLHAREWIGITSALYIANQIITEFKHQPDFVQNKDWKMVGVLSLSFTSHDRGNPMSITHTLTQKTMLQYIIPLVNPDGYVYTQTKDRLWRKNRRENSSPKCPGVDLNRNYPFLWEHIKNTEECSVFYPGPVPYSEPETQAVMRVFTMMEPRIPSAAIDIHSFGEMILYPWTAINTPSAHHRFLHSTAEIMASIIQNTTGTKYDVGSPWEFMYLASGSIMDWFHHKGLILSYAFETRDNGTYGFLLPPAQIKDTGKELFEAVKSLAKTIDFRRYGFKEYFT